MHVPNRPRPRFRRSQSGAEAALIAMLVAAAAPTTAAGDAASGGVPAVAAPVPEAPAAHVGAHAPTAPEADTVVVVVSPASPVTEMPRLHLSDLYLGRTSRLPDGQPAEPIDQEPGSEARREFYERFLGRSQSEIKAHWSKAVFTGRGRPPRDVADGEAMKELLSGNTRAVGYIDRSLVDESVRVVRVTGSE